MDFFQLGPIPANAIRSGHYNYGILALSYFIAVLTFYVALDIAGRLRAEMNWKLKWYWLIGGAIAVGSGIWSMNFIGMLAFITPVSTQYDIFLTSLSRIVTFLVSGYTLFILRKKSHPSYLALGGIVIGIGLVAMHYIGLYSIEWPVITRHTPGLFFTSIAIAIVTSEATLWLASFSNQGPFKKQIVVKIVSALILAGAICSMYYTGTAAAVFIPTQALELNATGVIHYGFAFYVAGITTFIIVLALVASTHKQLLVNAVQEEKNFLNAVLYNLKDGIIACDVTEKIILINPAFQDMIDASTHSNLEDYVFYYPNSDIPVKFEQRPLLLALQGTYIHSLELILKNKNNVKYNVIVNGQPLINKEKKIIGAVIAVHDITKQKRMAYQLMMQATHDTLTGLPNRVLLMDRIKQAITHAKRNHTMIALFFIDIDQFKTINDHVGHAAGDELLRITGQRLMQCLREMDTAARLGGDELVVLLNSLNREEDALLIARKILTKLSEPLEISHHRTKVTASIGISIYPKHGEDADTLLQKADAAMYAVKSKNRNNVRLYSDKMNIRIVKRGELEQYLFNAVDDQQFVIYYQPIVDLYSGYIVGVEALLRWNHPTLGLLLPMDFISLAEERGEIVKIGEWLIRTVSAQNKAWQNLGLTPIYASVNISSLQLKESDFLNKLKEVLHETELEPKYLELELTESIILQNPSSALPILSALKEIGISIALDDFGTGYSSFVYLSQLPVDKLKIDKSFVRGISEQSKNSAIVLAIIEMAAKMNLKLTAEGMETENELAFLRAHNCHQVQGHYFSRPLPLEKITTLLTKNPCFL